MRGMNYCGNLENLVVRHVHPSNPNARLSVGNASTEVRQHYKDYFKQEAQILKDFNMVYSAAYTGMKVPKGWNQMSDYWKITLTDERTGKVFTLDFKQGLGHRYIKSLDFTTEAVIVTPKPFDVLYCIRLDNPQGFSFEDWCEDFGYGTDSRKALEIYLACQQQTDDFRRVFPCVNLNEYGLLENY